MEVKYKNKTIEENREFRRLNEILYVLYSVRKFNLSNISKIGVQKCIYFCEILSPLREIILSFINFIYWHRGPYSKDVQNLLDYLVSIDAVNVVSFSTYGANSYANYMITEAGCELVENLAFYPKEKERLEWIEIVMRIIRAYTGSTNLGEEYDGIDKIIDLVYQEPSFKEVRQEKTKHVLLPVGERDNLTMELVYFLERIEENLPKVLDREKYKLNLDTILLSFFEYLYLEYLSQS